MSSEINTITREHPDTQEGVQAMLTECFTCPPFEGATFERDFVHSGVWLVIWPNGEKCIAYLAGHGPVGNDAEFEN